MNQLKHRKANKNMTYNQKFKIKWNNTYLQSIGYFEPIISLKKLFN